MCLKYPPRTMRKSEFEKFIQDPRELIKPLDPCNRNIIELAITTREVYPNPETDFGEDVMKDCRTYWQAKRDANGKIIEYIQTEICRKIGFGHPSSNPIG